MSEKQVMVKRETKTVYRVGDKVQKTFIPTHPKANIFNEAVNQARVEETGLSIPAVQGVTCQDGSWTIELDYVEGKTMADLMKENPGQMETYMEQLVDIQMEVFGKQAPLLNRMKDKLMRQINVCGLDATTRYELTTRLDGMPKHKKLCHGDFVPSNIVIKADGSYAILDWAHATQGNASGDAANTYLMFALEDEKTAELYLEMFCRKTDTAKQYVQQWLPVVAAAWLTKCKPEQKAFLEKWADVVEYQ